MTIRPARVGDVPGIYELIATFAERKLMIRRSMAELYESIREFMVAVDDENRLLGCAALHVFWDDLAEIRCLAVAEHAQGRAIGRQLVNACWETAQDLEVKSVFALTTASGFFERCGYHAHRKVRATAAHLERVRALPCVSELHRSGRSFARSKLSRHRSRGRPSWPPPKSERSMPTLRVNAKLAS